MIAEWLQAIGNAPPTNPGFLVAVPPALYTVNMSGTVLPAYNLKQSANQGLWLLNFNFNTHPLISSGKKTVASIGFTSVIPSGALQVVTSSLYNNFVGITIVGGTVNTTYSIVVSVVLNDSTNISSTLALTLLN